MKAKTAWAFLFGAMLAPMLAGAAWAQKGPGPGPDQDKEPPPGMEDERKMPPLPPEAAKDEEQARGFIRENIPEMQEEVEHLRRDNPQKYFHKLRELGPMLKDHEAREMLKRNMKAEFKVRQLVQGAKKAQGAEKETLKKDLEKALGEEFDAKLAGHELKLKKMQDEISQLKARIEKRKAVKDKIVQKRLGEMMGDVESWDW